MKLLIKKVVKNLGVKISRINKSDKDILSDAVEDEFWEIYNECKTYTMTSLERMYSLYKSVDYVLNNNIAGDFVECGVWRGGSSMLLAYMLKNRGISEKKIYLYDTFEGMSAPTIVDEDFKGREAKNLLNKSESNKETSIWCLADLQDVKRNMQLTGLDETQIIYVKGKVENTIPKIIPSNISILRLDTDWYESTKHELIHLYPLLTKPGVLIIDDYGYWKGCRQAVDEYIAENNLILFLSRIDNTGRISIKYH